METLPATLVSLLLQAPESVVVVGTGSQARQMRAYLERRMRLRTADVPGFSSADAPLGRRLYLLCATPHSAAATTLIQRGVPPDALVIWAELLAAMESGPAGRFNATLRLRALDETNHPLPPVDCSRQLHELLTHCSTALGELESGVPTADPAHLQLIETLSSAYLLLRQQWATRHPAHERRLLFPAPGRSGGRSLFRALNGHPRIALRVDYEGSAATISQMLAHHCQGRLSDTVMAALLSRRLDAFDCLGGNPFCFLMPFLRYVPWFECHMLEIERPTEELRESMLLRNFHYSTHDFLPNRITAADWGDMSAVQWVNLSIEAKIDWYIPKAQAAIRRGAGSCIRTVSVPLAQMLAGLNETLAAMDWPTVTGLLHTNRIPKDRVYSLDERVKLYQEEREAE